MRMRSMEAADWAERRIPKCTDASFSTVTVYRGKCNTFNQVTEQYSSNLFNNTSPDKGVGVNINITMRNRTAQADQARSQMEYRQAQMRLQQLYTQIRIEVINGQYALTNDRAQVLAAQAARDFAAQSLDAEQKKYKLGASTTATGAAAGKNLAMADNTLISATAAVCEGSRWAANNCSRIRWTDTGSVWWMRRAG